MAAEAQRAPLVRDRENAPIFFERYPVHDLDDDTSGLMAWVDLDCTFNAVGADGVIRSYGDGPAEQDRLAADMAEPAAANVKPQQSMIKRLKAFWRRIEPGFTVDHDSFIERWDSAGEGRATSVCFEGFGLTFSFFIGRTPKFEPYADNERTAQLTRWYNGEDEA